jgi:hypothetical protein
LLGGALVLGYGFANLGVRTGGVPLPLTELVLLPLIALSLSDRHSHPGARVMIPLAVFVGVIALRLVVDYPVYGRDAIRDATTGIEAASLLVGYRAVVRDGVTRWIRRLAVVLLVVMAYGSLYPVRAQLSSISPTVGLQREVPLFGSMAGVAFAVVAAALFFATFTAGWRRVALIGWALGVSAIFQQRSLYLLIPAAVVLLGWATRRSARMLAAVGVALVIGVLAMSTLLPDRLEGRLGPTTPAFVLQHAKTLFGEGGPGKGSIDDRKRWADRTLKEVTRSPATLAFGLGLGPDLTFGFRRGGEVAVRKPHDDYLEILARTGLVGLVTFGWLLAMCVVPIVRRARAGSGDAERLCAWILAAAFVYLGVAAVQPLLSFSYGTVPLFVLLGMGLAAARLEPGGGAP